MDQTVDPAKMDYLTYFIKNVSGKGFNYSCNTLRDFWIRTRVYSLKKEKSNIANFTNIKLLNVLAEVCGYKNFGDFIKSHYRKHASNLKILILPFPGNTENKVSVELLLNKRLEMFADAKKLDITIIFKQMSSKWSSKRYFTPKLARNEGLIEGVDLVIFGDILSQPFVQTRIALQYVMVDPNYRIESIHEKAVADLFNYSDLMAGSIPNELDAVIFWCLGIRDFLTENYDKRLLIFY